MTATVTAVPRGWSATISLSEKLPDSEARSSSPTSIARPPKVVTTSACSAASRLARLPGSKPMSRNEKIVVSSQNTNRSSRLSERTRPSIAPMNAVRFAAKAARWSESERKYQVQ